MNKFKELIKNPHFKWFNIFLRDIFLILVIGYINYSTNFRSWWVAFTTGMLVVWISWQFTDYLNYKKSLSWTLQ